MLNPKLRSALIFVLILCIFAVDTITDLEIAAAVFYVVVVLLAVGRAPTRGVIALAGLCVVLTLLSFMLTPSGDHEAGLINASISIAAIGITTYLAIKMVAAEAAAHEARAQLARMARVTSLGALTGSIAHEVNQPLAAIVTSGNAGLRWLDQDPPNLEKARRAIDRIVADANRASDVITRIRRLARSEPPRRDRFSFNEAIKEAVALAQGEIDQNRISLRLNLADDLPPVWADRVQIQQVLGNLILNAIEAMRAVPDHERHMIISSTRTASEEIEFAIADSGVGLSPHTFEHLFDAFWTTKEGGMGMGLTISRSIIETHGGHLRAAANSPRGATFQFALPLSEGSEA